MRSVKKFSPTLLSASACKSPLLGRAPRSRLRRIWLLSLLLGTSSIASAAPNACGNPDRGRAVCTPAGNPYPTGIQYSAASVDLAPGVRVTPAFGFFEADLVSVIDQSMQDGAVTTAQDVVVSNNAGLNRRAIVVEVGGRSTIVNQGTVFAVAGLTGRGSNVAITNSGSVSATAFMAGSPGYGILAEASAGTATIVNSGSVSFGSTFFGEGISASASDGVFITNSGPLTVNVGASFRSGRGITAISSGPIVVDSSGRIDVETGRLSTGITATTGGDITVNAGGAIRIVGSSESGITTPRPSAAIRVNSDAGQIVVDAADINVTARRSLSQIQNGDFNVGGVGISAVTRSGNVRVGSGRIIMQCDNAEGIAVRTDTGNIAITSETLMTEGARSGAIVASSSAGRISVNGGSLVTDGPNSAAISATTISGDVEVQAGNISTSNVSSIGILASSASRAVSVTAGTVATTGSDSAGITATSADGDVQVSSGTIATAGLNSVGIRAVSTLGAVSVTSGSVTTSGDSARAISAASGTGQVSVSSDAISTNRANAGGIVALSEAGAVSVRGGPVATTGADSAAVTARSADGPVEVRLTTASTTGLSSIGIAAASTAGAVSVTAGTVTTTAGAAPAIRAVSDAGPVTVAAGTVSTGGANAGGIVASSESGAVSVTSASVATTGARSIGIAAASETGAVLVAAGQVSTAGAQTNAVVARGVTADVTAQNAAVTGAGSIAVSATGRDRVRVAIGSSSARDAEAVLTVSSRGSADGSIGGAVASTTGDAVRLSGATTASLTVASGGSVSGGRSAILVEAAERTTLTNAGTITGGSGFAIDASGGAATIANSGTVTGGVRLTDNADRFENSGTWNVRSASTLGGGNDNLLSTGTLDLTATLDLGAGNDLLRNTGTLRLGADVQFGAGADRFENGGTIRFSASGPSTVTLSGLEITQNSGLIDLRNGRVGEALVIPGAFVGAGSGGLGLELSDTANDQRRVGSASGRTEILLSGADASLTLGRGPVLVQASGASAADAFVLAGGPVGNGLFEGILVYDPSSFAFALVGTPREPLFQLTRIQAAARAVSAAPSDAWSARNRHARDIAASAADAASGSRFWVQLSASGSEHGAVRTFEALGGTRAVDVAFEQDLFAVQAGFDILGSAADGFTLGVTGGYARSDATFRTGGGTVDVGVLNGGIYAGWRSGTVFVNALVRADKIVEGSASTPGAFDVELSGNAIGLDAEAGLRFDLGSWFVEPVARLSYTRTSLDGFDLPGVLVEFGGGDALVGRAGVRAGTAVPLGGARSLVAYGGAAYVGTLSGEDRTLLTGTGTSLAFRDRLSEDHVEGSLGVALVAANGVTAFLEGKLAKGDERESHGLRLGLSLGF